MLISLTFNKLKLYSEKERHLEALKVKDLFKNFLPFHILQLVNP